MCSCCTFTVNPNSICYQLVLLLLSTLSQMELRSTVNRRRSQIVRTNKVFSLHTYTSRSYTQLLTFLPQTAKTTSVKLGVTYEGPRGVNTYSIGSLIKSFKCPPLAVLYYTSILYSKWNQSSPLLKIPNSPSSPLSHVVNVGKGPSVYYILSRVHCVQEVLVIKV